MDENWSDNEASSGETTASSAVSGNIRNIVKPSLRLENEDAFKEFNIVDKNINTKEESKSKRAKTSGLIINKGQINFTPNERTKRKSAINASEKVQSWLGELAKKR